MSGKGIQTWCNGFWCSYMLWATAVMSHPTCCDQLEWFYTLHALSNWTDFAPLHAVSSWSDLTPYMLSNSSDVAPYMLGATALMSHPRCSQLLQWCHTLDALSYCNDITLCSQQLQWCHPLHPLSNWSDASVQFTAAGLMHANKVLYTVAATWGMAWY